MPNQPSLLVRLLNTPDLPAIVPRLPPEVLHRVIQTCGLEDCGEFVALATPEQLGRVLDLDLWRVRARTADEEFDADRFGLWVAVLMESGADSAAATVMGLDVELVIAGFARHAAVFDGAAVASFTTLDGDLAPGREIHGTHVTEIGGYAIGARRASAWAAIVDLLAFLAAAHAEYFDRIMRGCVRLSNEGREDDGLHDVLDDAAQDMFDLASDRETRQEQRGYISAAQAHAFLKGARGVPLHLDVPTPSAIARAYFRALDPAGDPEAPAASAAAVPRSVASAPHSGASVPHSVASAPHPLEPDGTAAVIEILRDAGVLTLPRSLIGAADGSASRLSWLQAHAAIHPAAAEELAFLANVMMAGCSILGRPFTPREASDGAAAVCNLGLENWPSHWPSPDLITAFQVGWTIIHRDVCAYAAEGVIAALPRIRCEDRDTHMRLDGLRRELLRALREGEPWRARDALDVIMMLDAPAWAALLAFLDECPAIHAAVHASRRSLRAVDPSAFTFISENRDIAVAHEFIASLPSLLAD